MHCGCPLFRADTLFLIPSRSFQVLGGVNRGSSGGESPVLATDVLDVKLTIPSQGTHKVHLSKSRIVTRKRGLVSLNFDTYHPPQITMSLTLGVIASWVELLLIRLGPPEMFLALLLAHPALIR